MTEDCQKIKADLRKKYLDLRNSIPETTRIERSLLACEQGAQAIQFDAGTVIAGFHPIRSEIDPRPMMFELARLGARLCLPVVVDKTTIEFRHLERGAPLIESGSGTVGPDENAEVLDPEILIVPLSVFDCRGGRIGYGAGYYDRAIEQLIAKDIVPKLYGMAFSCQETETVPMESHDRYLDGTITEDGYSPAVS